jgi:hypothetical protein
MLIASSYFLIAILMVIAATIKQLLHTKVPPDKKNK